MNDKENFSQSDEINFEPFFQFIINILKKIGEFFRLYISSLLKGFKTVAVYCLLGGAISVGMSFLIPPHYEMEMIVKSNYLSRAYYYNEISALEKLIEDQNYEYLSEILNISTQQAEELYGIEISDGLINLLGKDTSIVNAKSFAIHVEVHDVSFNADLEKGILKYLEENPFALEYKAHRTATLNNLISKLEKDINEIDTLINILAEEMVPSSNAGSGFIFGEPINPTTLLNQSDQLYSKLLHHKAELAFIDNIHLIKSFTPYNKPSFPKKSTFALYGILMGFLLSSIVVLIKKTK
jgi:hypothetical protein